MKYIVGFRNLAGDEETMAPKLAEILGMSLYDARLRLRAADGGPAVGTLFNGREDAQACSAALQAAGFQAVVLSPEMVETEARRFLVRSFSLGGDSLGVISRQGENLQIPFRSVDLILRGTEIMRQTETETVREKKFSLGRAVISGGLVMTKKTTTTHESTTESRENFLHVYAGTFPPVVFRESSVLYDSLGPEMQASRQLNFNFFLQKLREKSPNAVFDDRLMNRLGQSRVLGSVLHPESHLDIAVSLLAAALRPA
jgi:hypothetical protein